MRRDRRRALTATAGSILSLFDVPASGRDRTAGGRFTEEAFRLRDEATAAGDQPYGAVLVLDGVIVGRGHSRVVIDREIARHAERVALKDAQDRLGRERLDGAVIFSSTIPCMICQPLLANAGVVRMIHGRDGVDAGAPQGGRT